MVQAEVRVHPWISSLIESDLSERSKEQYIRQLNRLHALAGGRSLETILTHPDGMKSRIDRHYDNNQSRKALLSAIRAVFKYNEHLKSEYAEEFTKWKLFSQEMDRSIIDRVSSAQPTQRELLNWVPWVDILRKQQDMSRSETEYGSFEHLVLSMYTLMEPMRADFGNMRIYYEGRDAVPTQESDANYIILSPHPGQSKLILNQYKTRRKYGSFSRVVPDELVHIIMKSLHLFPRTHLFVDTEGQPYYKRNTYNKTVNRVLEKLFKKKLSISLMRHAFISGLDFNESTPAQLMAYSKNMQHSMGMQQLYRRKIPDVRVTQEMRRPQQVYVPQQEPPRQRQESDGEETGRIILI